MVPRLGEACAGAKNVIGIIVLMGLVLVPPMYAWFNIAGSWDPYGHTEGLKVAAARPWFLRGTLEGELR